MFVCKSISLANFLIANGSNIAKVDKDNISDKHIIFLFKKDNLLDKNLKKWQIRSSK